MTILFVDLLVRGYFSPVATHQQRLDHYSNIVSVHSAVHSQLLAAHFWQQLYFFTTKQRSINSKNSKEIRHMAKYVQFKCIHQMAVQAKNIAVLSS